MNSLIEITAIEIKELAVVEPKQASEKFELIAKTMSDEQLAEVIENIDIVTLTQINGQHDISFPSIISELMTPERIRDIVCQQRPSSARSWSASPRIPPGSSTSPSPSSSSTVAIATRMKRAIAMACTPKRKISRSPSPTASASRARMPTTTRWMIREAS